jgi:hypothetical protein
MQGQLPFSYPWLRPAGCGGKCSAGLKPGFPADPEAAQDGLKIANADVLAGLEIGERKDDSGFQTADDKLSTLGSAWDFEDSKVF